MEQNPSLWIFLSEDFVSTYLQSIKTECMKNKFVLSF